MKKTKNKDRRMKFIWNSNGSHVPSGYGVETRDLLKRFHKDGWPIAHIAFTGTEGGMISKDTPNIHADFPIYPKMGDVWGSDAMLLHGRHFGANVTFSMQDVWCLNPQYIQQIPIWIPYVPIDQEPVPVSVLNMLRYAYKIITFSKWGHDALQKAGFVSTLIPEGTDIEIMKPMDKVLCRRFFNIPQDKIVVGMVGANKENPPRKGWQQALEAFKLFHDKHPESIFLFESNQNYPGGFPIGAYAQTLGISSAIMCIDEYMGTFHGGSEYMAKWYNCCDFLLHASLSEGFGLCIVEAQACGVPVIVNDACSMPELIVEGVTGYKTKVAAKHFTNALGYFNIPDVNSLYENMEKMISGNLKKMGEAARKHIVENYNIDVIFHKYWKPFLEDLQSEVLPPIDIPQEKK